MRNFGANIKTSYHLCYFRHTVHELMNLLVFYFSACTLMSYWGHLIFDFLHYLNSS